MQATTTNAGRLVAFVKASQRGGAAAPLVACAALLAVQVGPWWYSSIDSTSYLSMARSLAKGAGPLNLGSRLWWYSPGYPALVSPLFHLAERPFFWISAVQWLLAVGLMLGVYVWARRAAPGAAVWIASLTVINHGLWVHYRRPLSEIAFMCALVWAVVLLDRLREETSKRAFAARLACSALLVALVCIIRPVGVMLAPALAVSSFCCRMPRGRAIAASLVIGVAAALPVGLFVMHERISAAELGGRTYVDEFQDAAQTPLSSWSAGVQMCISDIGRVCIPGLFKSHGTPGDWTDPNMLIHLPFFALVCYGWRRWMLERHDLFGWYMPFYFVLIAAHAMDTGARLLLPLLPALLICVWFALQGLASRRQAVFGICLALQLAVAGGYWLVYDLPKARESHQRWPEIDQLASSIRAQPGAAVKSDLPGELHLMLELALDRPLVRHRETDAAGASWLVALCPGDSPMCLLPHPGITRCCLRRNLAAPDLQGEPRTSSQQLNGLLSGRP